MPLKKLDGRIRTLVENSVALRHRCLFIVVGEHGRDQVVILHHMMSKAVVKARPSVLWCYKKELGFSSHRKKHMKKLQKKIKSGSLDVKKDDPFELFIAATNIRYCYYKDTHTILGNTYGMCVLQDFEALTPNLLARTIETVEGGGIVVLLLGNMDSLRKLCTMTMDVHSRYRTATHKQVIPRFNERFLLSLADCPRCMVVDDQLNILPISSHMLSLKPVSPKATPQGVQGELEALKDSLEDTQPLGHLVGCCRTLDQAKALLKFVEVISEQTLHCTVAMTASRGRGKSAALGLAISAAIAFGYSNIFVTSPSPENLRTLFEFVLKGFDSIDYKEHEHYEVVQSTNQEFNGAVVRVNVFYNHRQTVQYIHPADAHKLEQAELVCIDEAAAIPLPLVRKLVGRYLVLMASTINGYEGTGRSLSLKLIDDMRRKSAVCGASGRVLKELSLHEPIRYSSHDPIEAWLHKLLCLDVGATPRTLGGCPNPSQCNLYYVNRDTLFCYHKASEEFLQCVMSLYVASHYKNSPNDLQLLSDAPAHHIFVLVGPVSLETTALPEVLCVLQVCLEGAITRDHVWKSLERGVRGSGDLIPWTLSQQFADDGFPGLSGVRVVRIATHPDFQRMGYGTRALQLLVEYYSGQINSFHKDEVCEELGEKEAEATKSTGLLQEVIAPRRSLPPLLSELSERKPESLDYIGVCFGVTADLLRFWSSTKNQFVPVYLRQTPNELTGEHSCIMLRPLVEGEWLELYQRDFRCRYLSLLGYQFRSFSPQLALSLLRCASKGLGSGDPTLSLDVVTSKFSMHDLKRLELYNNNQADYHLITDLLPAMSNLYFTYKMSFKLPKDHTTVLLALGLQHKTVEVLTAELNPVEPDNPDNRTRKTVNPLGLLHNVVREFVKLFKSLEEKEVVKNMPVSQTSLDLKPITDSIDKELSTVAKELLEERGELLKSPALAEYAITGCDEDWTDVLADGKTKPAGIVSIKKRMTGNRKRVQTHKAKTHKRTKHS